jgi:hypothetical protein
MNHSGAVEERDDGLRYNSVVEKHTDPITTSVVQHRLHAIVEEMGEAMLRTSYSQILNSSRDFHERYTLPFLASQFASESMTLFRRFFRSPRCRIDAS